MKLQKGTKTMANTNIDFSRLTKVRNTGLCYFFVYVKATEQDVDNILQMMIDEIKIKAVSSAAAEMMDAFMNPGSLEDMFLRDYDENYLIAIMNGWLKEKGYRIRISEIVK